MSTNGSTTSKSSNRPKFSAQVQDLLGAAKKVLSHEKDIASLDQILDEKKELEGKLKSKAAEVLAKDKVIASKDQEIASLQLAKNKEIASLQSAKNKEIAKLQSTNDSLFEEFQQKYKAWDIGTTKQEDLAGEVAQLTLKLGQAGILVTVFVLIELLFHVRT
jgi:chromosome segregation ATPase